MSVFERFGRVVKAELGHLVRGSPADAREPASTAVARPSVAASSAERVSRRESAVVDVEGALRVLELTGTPAINEVRAQYRTLSKRYYPKTKSPLADEAHSARVVIDALTDAVELLEEHLLPV